MQKPKNGVYIIGGEDGTNKGLSVCKLNLLQCYDKCKHVKSTYSLLRCL
jgi:hypothetical protein